MCKHTACEPAPTIHSGLVGSEGVQTQSAKATRQMHALVVVYRYAYWLHTYTATYVYLRTSLHT